MAAWQFDPRLVDLDTESLVLVVGHRARDNSIEAYRVECTTNVTSALRDVCRRTIAAIRDRSPVHFDADMRVIESGTYMAVAAEGVQTDSRVLEALRSASTLPGLSAQRIADVPFTFYGVTLESSEDSWTVFVRSNDPRRSVKGGRLLGMFDDTLREIDVPVFVFEEVFDAVLVPGGAAVLRINAFEQLFRDVSLMTDRIPVWVEAVSTPLPLEDGAQEWLQARAESSANVARKLRSIHERGHLESPISIQRLRAEFKRKGFEADRFVRSGHLFLERSNINDLLDVLNEDLFRGGLSGADYRASSKSLRS